MSNQLETRRNHEDAWKAAYAVHRAQNLEGEEEQKLNSQIEVINGHLTGTDYQAQEIFDDEENSGGLCAVIEPKPSAVGRPHIAACAGADPLSNDMGHLTGLGPNQVTSDKMNEFRTAIGQIDNHTIHAGLSLGGEHAQANGAYMQTTKTGVPGHTDEVVTFMGIGGQASAKELLDRQLAGRANINYPPTTHYRVAGDSLADRIGILTPGINRVIGVEGYIDGKRPGEPLPRAGRFGWLNHNAAKIDAAVEAGVLGRIGNFSTIEQVVEAPKKSLWTAGAHPSIPIEIDGETYNVRGKAKPPAATAGVPEYVTGLINANPALGAFKETQRQASSSVASSGAGDIYDLLGEILGVTPPARMSTPAGNIPLQSEWLHKDDVYALMNTPAYQTGNLPQSKPVRETVTNFFQQAYPGKYRLDATGRPIHTPTVSRPNCAPTPLQGKKHLTSHGRQEGA